MPSRISRRPAKRSKTVVVPTVAELQNHLRRYNIDTKIDEIEDESFLRLVFHVLRKKFHPTTTQSKRDAVRVANIDVAALRIPESIATALPCWLENRETFWTASSFQGQPFDNRPCGGGNVRRFVESSWAVQERLSQFKLLWRFSSVALCLTLMQWKPEWKLSSYLVPECVGAFLSTFGCSATESDVRKTAGIIRSGQRRLSFCEQLSKPENTEPNPQQRPVVYSKLETLGILFLDDIPDSSFDGERSMSQQDVNITTESLRTKHIRGWLVNSGSGQHAIKLLEFPVHHTFLELRSSERVASTPATRVEGRTAISRATQQQVEAMPNSTATQQNRQRANFTRSLPPTRDLDITGADRTTVPDSTIRESPPKATDHFPAASDAVIDHACMRSQVSDLPPDSLGQGPLAPLSLGTAESQDEAFTMYGASNTPFAGFSAPLDLISNWQWFPSGVGQYAAEVRQDNYFWPSGDRPGFDAREFGFDLP